MIKFNRLFAYLAEHDISRTELQKKTGISSWSHTRMRQNKSVSTKVIEAVCTTLGCTVDDIMEYGPEEI